MTDKITITGDNEITAYPWWAIVDARPGMIARDGCVGTVARMITGPFFSRASAEEVLATRRHRFGKHARVYCFSGHMSPDYRERIDAGNRVPRKATCGAMNVDADGRPVEP